MIPRRSCQSVHVIRPWRYVQEVWGDNCCFRLLTGAITCQRARRGSRRSPPSPGYVTHRHTGIVTEVHRHRYAAPHPAGLITGTGTKAQCHGHWDKGTVSHALGQRHRVVTGTGTKAQCPSHWDKGTVSQALGQRHRHPVNTHK